MTNARERAQTGKTRKPWDSHITVYYGDRVDNVQVSGHVYTFDDKNGIPIRPLRAEERRFGHKSKRTATEFWKYDGQPKPRNAANGLVPRRY